MRRGPNLLLVLLIGAVAVCAACEQTPPAGYAKSIDRGKVLYDTCVPCHRQDGHGRIDVAAPSIAGLQKWYVKSQLQKFRKDLRGAHPKDTAGIRMRAISKALQSEAAIESVAAYVDSMKPLDPPTTLEGDPEKGKTLYQPCKACHGPKGGGKKALKAPALTHSQDWYLYKQIQHFQDGVRGYSPKDTTGTQMAGLASSLPDDQAVRDVIAYIQTFK